MDDAPSTRRPSSLDAMFAPLRAPVFRNIWLASLLSNLGLLIGGVGAAWAMTQLTTSITMVAMVQAASTGPIMLIALPAGAIADMYDRRKVGIAALLAAMAAAAALATFSWLGLITPAVLLIFIFTIGSGMALYAPAWQASVSQQVPSAALPAAIALNGISYNIARSFGPAVGGVIVAAFGATAAFGANALFYIPLVIALFLWRRELEVSRLPPERLSRAIVSGLRYVANSPPIRTVLVRTFLAGGLGGAIPALMPVIARDLLHGDAKTYGMMLGAFGLGSVVGALSLSAIRKRLDSQRSMVMYSLVLGVVAVIVGLSRSPWLTAPALLLAGACWTSQVVQFNIGVQLSSPRWVAARALAAYQASVAGGIAIGSIVWGQVASHNGVGAAIVVSGVAMLCTPILGRWLRMPATEGLQMHPAGAQADPEVNLALTGRSGPIVVNIEYRVSLGDARAFYQVMQDVQLTRRRNGGYGWSISRDITDPEIWVERFHCPTWHDFLRLRDRPTQGEREQQDRARAFHIGPEPIFVRRMLERPFGSVRWTEDVRDDRTLDVPPPPHAT